MGEVSPATWNVLSKALLGPANLRGERARGGFLRALNESGTDPAAAETQTESFCWSTTNLTGPSATVLVLLKRQQKKTYSFFFACFCVSWSLK